MPDGSTREAVREQLRALVIEGELRPGDRLVERQLAERLGVSRVPVREALRELAHEGLVEERPTRGMVVRRLSADEVETLFEVRGALEDLICERVVAHAVDDDLDRLDDVVARARAAVRRPDPVAARALNAEFHTVLTELAGTVLAAVMEPVAGRMRWLLTQHEDAAEMLRSHEGIAKALRRRDLETAQLLCRNHLEDSRAEVAGRLGPTWTSPRSP